MQSLPDEILEKIFLNLSPFKDFDLASLVCKRWNAVIASMITGDFPFLVWLLISLHTLLIAGTIMTYKRNFDDAFRTGNITWTELCINA